MRCFGIIAKFKNSKNMNKFKNIQAMAQRRKGGQEALFGLLLKVISKEELRNKGDDRFLSMMTRCVFNSGFHWQVISKKWPSFEEAFFGFDLGKLALLSIEQWDAYYKDKRIVRNGQKINSLIHNAQFVMDVAKEYGSFAKFIANWPEEDLVGLFAYLKKHGSRLGGNTSQYFLRFMGKDSFILSPDVTAALRDAELDVRDYPTTKRELQLVQDAFNEWHQQTGLPYTHISKILAFSIGENYVS